MLNVSTSDSPNGTELAVTINRTDSTSYGAFYHDGIALAAADAAHINYGAWSDKADLKIEVGAKTSTISTQTLSVANMPIADAAGFVQSGTGGTFTTGTDANTYIMKLTGVAATTGHFSLAAPLDVHQENTDAFMKAWSESPNQSVSGFIRLDSLQTYVTLFNPTYDPAMHTLGYQVQLDAVFPANRMDPPITKLPASFQSADILIQEDTAFLEALGKVQDYANLSANGDFSIGAGTLNLSSNADFSANAGVLPGADVPLFSYLQTATNAALSTVNGVTTLTLNGIDDQTLIVATQPALGLRRVFSELLLGSWSAGGSTTAANAILDTGTQQIDLVLDNPVSDLTAHTIQYKVNAADLPDGKFGGSTLLIALNPLLKAALETGLASTKEAPVVQKLLKGAAGGPTPIFTQSQGQYQSVLGADGTGQQLAANAPSPMDLANMFP